MQRHLVSALTRPFQSCAGGQEEPSAVGLLEQMVSRPRYELEGGERGEGRGRGGEGGDEEQKSLALQQRTQAKGPETN